MNIAQKNKLEEFIKNNNITFEKGRRNTDSVALSGYALSLGMNTVGDLEKLIDVLCPKADWEYSRELERVFKYASDNNYGNWWDSQEAKNSYKL